jgi:uncharacterized cupredoxin-like copper-binding protein
VNRSPHRPRHLRPARLAGLLLIAAPSLVAGAACGSDEGAEPTTTTSPATAAAPSAPDGQSAAEVDPKFAELCDLAAEVNEQDGPPTVAQLEQYAELAPEDLRPAVESLAAAFAAAGDDVGAVFSDPSTATALEQITEFESSTCGLGSTQDPSVSEIDPDATRVEVIATDYHFDADFPTSPGRYSFVMTNEGDEPHIAILARLEDGVSVEEAMASEGEEGIAEMFESEVAPPGSGAVITAELAAGNWVLVCPIPNAEGTPHVALGMVHDFTVA